MSDRLEREAEFYNGHASKATIDKTLAEDFFAFESPVSHYGAVLSRMEQTLLAALGDVNGKRALV